MSFSLSLFLFSLFFFTPCLGRRPRRLPLLRCRPGLLTRSQQQQRRGMTTKNRAAAAARRAASAGAARASEPTTASMPLSRTGSSPPAAARARASWSISGECGTGGLFFVPVCSLWRERESRASEHAARVENLALSFRPSAPSLPPPIPTLLLHQTRAHPQTFSHQLPRELARHLRESREAAPQPGPLRALRLPVEARRPLPGLALSSRPRPRPGAPPERRRRRRRPAEPAPRRGGGRRRAAVGPRAGVRLGRLQDGAQGPLAPAGRRPRPLRRGARRARRRG